MDSKLIKEFALLKELKEFHEKQATLLGSSLQRLGNKVFQAFADEGIESFRIRGDIFRDKQDRIIRPEVKPQTTVVKKNERDFFTWMRDNECGDLIKEVVHPATLKKWVIERQNKNLPLPPEELLRVFMVETAKITRAPKAK